MKLIEIRRMAPVAGDYGIEIEVEGENLPHMDNKWWKTHEDGSLRGEAHEYVTNGPIEKKIVRNVLNNLNSGFIKKNSLLNLSYRTSVHVHMNVQELEIEKILSIVYLYYAFEEVLLKLCGESRIGNRFCLRLQDAEEIVEIIKTTFSANGGGIRNLDEGRAKYCSLNLVPMRTFGSIEFRGMRGTTNTDTIVQWIDILNCLKENKFSSAKEVSDFVAEKGILALGIEVFGKHFPFLMFEGWEHEVTRNLSYLLEIPNTIKFNKDAKPEENKIPAYHAQINRAVELMEARLRQPAAPRRNIWDVNAVAPRYVFVDELMNEVENVPVQP